jgi:hypothetical protein
MKKNVTLLAIALLFTGVTAFAQLGAGISSHGFSIRTNPDGNSGWLLRSGFGFDFSPYYSYLSPEVAYIRRHHFTHRSSLYAGIGVKSQLEIDYDDIDLHTGLIIPVGLELFPIRHNDRFSVSLESGLKSREFDNNDYHHRWGMRRYGLVELTFYLGQRGGREYDDD